MKTWGAVVGAAALLMTVLDAGLLQAKRSYFTGGFLAADHLRSVTDALLFLWLSFAGDAAVIGALAALGLSIASLFRLTARAAVALALALPLFCLITANVIGYQLVARLGDAFDLSLMFDLTGKSTAEMLAVSAAQIAAPVTAILAAALAVLFVVRAIHRRDRRAGILPRPYRLRGITVAAVVLIVLSMGATTTARMISPEMDNGLRRKPSTKLLGTLIELISDVDRDGFGIVRTPTDPAPFDKRIYPYAVDVPGNGIDEDGVAGDLPIHVGPYVEESHTAAGWTHRPDVILVVLESFRGDVVGMTRDGHSVTPVLDAIAANGVSVAAAYSHNGYTAQSRYHLMTGRVARAGSETSLLDDFKANGYHVGYFSGQDDSFGGPELAVRTAAADRMFDARQAKSERYSTFTTAGSLAVPASTVLKHVSRFVEERPQGTPMFLYVNFHDTHYPYQHAGIPRRFAPTPLPEASIAPSRRAELHATYLDAAAHVDRAIGEVLATVRRSSGREPAIIVIGDHGESLFDDTFLGHGYALNDPQTRIPLVASGLGLKIDEPFGQADLRGKIHEALAAGSPDAKPVARAADRKRVFQYLGTLDRPRQISFISGEGRILYDLRSEKVCLPSGECLSPRRLNETQTRQFKELVWTWESMALSRQGAPPAEWQ